MTTMPQLSREDHRASHLHATLAAIRASECVFCSGDFRESGDGWNGHDRSCPTITRQQRQAVITRTARYAAAMAMINAVYGA